MVLVGIGVGLYEIFVMLLAIQWINNPHSIMLKCSADDTASDAELLTKKMCVPWVRASAPVSQPASSTPLGADSQIHCLPRLGL